MRKVFLSFFMMAIVVFSLPSHALYTELGISYGRKKTTFDTHNYLETESLTGSVSLYLMERLAVELSYTDAKATREEKAGPTDPRRVSYQTSKVLGADLILTFADRNALFQPYIKGGVARLDRTQEISIEGYQTYVLPVEAATVPSYGLGLRIKVSERLNLRLAYDIWKTPIGGGDYSDDTSLRAGITWAL